MDVAGGGGAAAGLVQPDDEVMEFDYNNALSYPGILHNVFMHLPLGHVMQYATVCSTWATVQRHQVKHGALHQVDFYFTSA
jgi:hypothetical protein